MWALWNKLWSECRGQMIFISTCLAVLVGTTTIIYTLERIDEHRGKGFKAYYMEEDRRTWELFTAETFTLDDHTRTAIFYDKDGVQVGKLFNVYLVSLR